MQNDFQDLRKLRDDIEAARAEATRLNNPTLHTVLTMGLLAVEDRMVQIIEGDGRTLRQVEALKRMIGAT